MFLAGLFAWAAVVKGRAPVRTERAFVRLGLRGARPLARVVPVVEALCAGALVTAPRVGGWLAFGLLVAFTGVLVPVVVAGRRVPCGCFGSGSEEAVTLETLVRNGLLMVGALMVASVSARSFSLPGVVAASASSVAAALVLALVRLRLATGRVFPGVSP